MSINYLASDKTFYLSGGSVSYVMHVDENGYLMNLYWGERLADGAVKPALENYPEGASFDRPALHLPWELPVRGSGWYGTPAVSAVNAAGDDVVVLRYGLYGKLPLRQREVAQKLGISRSYVSHHAYCKR